MGATKRLEKQAATRASLLLAAQLLFKERGYEAVTLREIAAAAKRSTGSVFANYADKEALFEAAVGRKPPPGRLRAFLAGMVHGVVTEEPRVLFADLYGAREP